MSKTKPRKKLFNTLSKKITALFILMTVLILVASCLVGYLKYSETIKHLYNENAYSIGYIAQSVATPENADFLESLIVYETDENGKYKLTADGKKIPKLQKTEMPDGTVKVCAETTLDMYADPATLEGEELERYNKYYEILDEIDVIRKQSGAKYLFFFIPCSGDRESDPYYVEGQEKFSHPYAVYLADARTEDKTLSEIGLDDDGIVAFAKSYGFDLKKSDLRDENGELKAEIFNNFCRLGLGDQSELVADLYDDTNQLFLTGVKRENYFETNTEFGRTTEGVLPIRNSKGEIFALLSVDIEMAIIEDTLLSYVLSAVLITVVLITLFMFGFLILIRFNIINPVKKITNATERFFDEDMTIDDSVKAIKTGDEIEELATAFTHMGTDLVDYVNNLTAITAEKNRIGAELDVAKNIQASALPNIFPPFPDCSQFDIFATMTPAKEVGGDFYDFFFVDKDHFAIVMADVSGKGVPAAMFMMISKIFIKSAAQAGLSPKEVLEKVNNQLCENNEAQMFVTTWLGIIDLTTGKMTCVNAGHELPAIYRKNGSYELLHDKHGFVVAGMENLKYKEYEIELNPGDRLFLYTDGVPEATNAQNELFGNDRMVESLNKAKELPFNEVLGVVHKDINEFVGEAPQFDDITMLSFEYKGNEEK